MSTINVELVGSTTRTHTDLADDIPVEHLMPSMVTLVGDGCPAEGRWLAYVPGGVRIDLSATLTQTGLSDGDTVYVTRSTHAIDPELPDPVPIRNDDASPTDRTSRVIPDRLTTRQRLVALGRALVGSRVTPRALGGGAMERVTDMWRWTDHGRRLDWIIGRPRLHRTVTIGVITQTDSGASAHTAVEVATALSAARADRVILVDGDPERAGVTRLTGVSARTVAGAADGVDSLDARFGSGTVTVLGCDLRASTTPGFDVYRRMLDRIRPSAGVVVIDCGPVGSSRLLDLCEQIVLVTHGPIDPRVERRFRNRPTVIAAARRGDAVDLSHIDPSFPTALGTVAIGDAHTGRELAAMLADGWARLGATV